MRETQVRAIFGFFVKDRRVLRGWTQHKLADRSGVSQIAIIKIDAGKLQPRLSTALKLAEALEFSLGEVQKRVKAGALSLALERQSPGVKARLNTLLDKLKDEEE